MAVMITSGHLMPSSYKCRHRNERTSSIRNFMSVYGGGQYTPFAASVCRAPHRVDKCFPTYKVLVELVVGPR